MRKTLRGAHVSRFTVSLPAHGVERGAPPAAPGVL